MLSIYATTEFIPEIERIVASQDRLDELVAIHNLLEVQADASSNSLIVDTRGIISPIDWRNTRPPYLLKSPVPFRKELLLGLIFAKLNNLEKAWPFLADFPELQQDLDLTNRLTQGYLIKKEDLLIPDTKDQNEGFRQLHNLAVVHHYGYLEELPGLDMLSQLYEEAIHVAPNGELAAFSTRHLGTVLLDAGNLEKAAALIERQIPLAISKEAQVSLKTLLVQVGMQQLMVPYDEQQMKTQKDLLWECLQFYELENRKVEAALLLIDASQIANISNSFSEALGYISKAIRYLDAENLPELSGNAQLRKGTLLYTWAQNGNPQFYKGAVNAYQEALKVFRQETAPDIFADIHHNLAVLYSEMPTEPKKRGIWAGVASSSFQEALNYFNKRNFPYQYGMICNNYGNALTKFPPAIHSDNYEKALYYYQEALDVRTRQYPLERAITLLNFLEASWQVKNEGDSFNEQRFQDMLKKAEEVKTLVDNPDMIAEAERHLDGLNKLRAQV